MIRLASILAVAGMLASALALPARADLSSKLGALQGDNLKGYLDPLPRAMSSSINSGLFQSGRVEKGGVHVTLDILAAGAEFPSDDRTFMPKDPFGFQPVTPTPVPTVIGDGNAVAVPDNGGSTPVYPGGFDISQFVMPVPQLTIGNFRGTQATIRWFGMDVQDSDVGRISFFGIGAQHSLSQYLPRVPVDLAAGVFYQSLKLGSGLLDTKALHLDVTASRRFGGLVKFEPYVSVGLDRFDMKVDYTYTGSGSSPGGDRLSVDFDPITNKHLAAGAQVALAFVRLRAEFVSAAYNGAALGLTFGR